MKGNILAEKRTYLPPCMELQRVDFAGLLLTDASTDGTRFENGDTEDLDGDLDGFIHCGAKQRGLWDDVDAE